MSKNTLKDPLKCLNLSKTSVWVYTKLQIASLLINIENLMFEVFYILKHKFYRVSNTLEGPLVCFKILKQQGFKFYIHSWGSARKLIYTIKDLAVDYQLIQSEF